MPTNNPPFFNIHLKGSRYKKHTLPVESLPDITEYGRFVCTLAKELFKQNRPGRIRVSPGFVQGFQLHLQNIAEGSAVACLTRQFERPKLLDVADEFDEARNLIFECVKCAAEGKKIPARFPKELLHYFEKFGSCMEGGDSFELEIPNVGKTVYTNTIRRKLVGATGRIRKPFDLVAEIYGVNVKESVFDFSIGGDEFQFSLDSPLEHDDVMNAIRQYRKANVRIRGTGEYDSTDKLAGIFEVSSIALAEEDEFDEGPDLTEQKERLSKLRAGWLNGDGQAVNPQLIEKIDGLVRHLVATGHLPMPYLYPTPTGGIRAEWTIAQHEVVCEVPPTGLQCQLFATDLRENTLVETEIDLTQDNYKKISGFIAKQTSA